MKNLQFIDGNNNLVKIEAGIDYGHLAISGEVTGCCGQCYDEISPATEAQTDLLDFWKEHHLHQPTEELTDRLNDILERLQGEWNCNRAEAAERSGHDIYNDNDEGMLQDIMEAKECTEHIALCIVAVMRQVGMEFSELDAITWEGSFNFNAYGVDYLAGTGDELDNLAREYMKDDDDCYLECWIDAVKNKGERRGYDDWCDYVVDMDGFAHILNSYDGKYTDEEVCGEWICTCRR